MRDTRHLKRIDARAGFHPTAIVHPRATIGEGVTIGPYSIIGEHVTVGHGCSIGSHVEIDGHTTIGRENVFCHGAIAGAAPQDLKYAGRPTFLEIGDGNTFREYVTIHRGSEGGGTTRIGSRCFIMAYAHVAHDCTIGDEVILANSVNLGGHAKVGDYANIGGVTPVHQFVSVGKYAFVGGGSRVEKDVPPFVKAAGSPTRAYGINSIGLERRGFSASKRAMIKKMFHVLYRSGLNVSQAVERIKNGSEFEDPERAIFVTFLETSVRGITR